MIWIIIEMLFLTFLTVLLMALYRSNRPFMTKFYFRMAGSENARKLYMQCLLIFLLLYHYAYAGRHFGEWGILLSTVLCAVLFSFRRTDKWLHKLHEDRKSFALTALLILVICAIPHLHTLAVTFAFLLLDAMFYPSCRVLANWQDKETCELWKDKPETKSENYY